MLALAPGRRRATSRTVATLHSFFALRQRRTIDKRNGKKSTLNRNFGHILLSLLHALQKLFTERTNKKNLIFPVDESFDGTKNIAFASKNSTKDTSTQLYEIDDGNEKKREEKRAEYRHHRDLKSLNRESPRGGFVKRENENSNSPLCRQSFSLSPLRGLFGGYVEKLDQSETSSSRNMK